MQAMTGLSGVLLSCNSSFGGHSEIIFSVGGGGGWGVDSNI